MDVEIQYIVEGSKQRKGLATRISGERSCEVCEFNARGPERMVRVQSKGEKFILNIILETQNEWFTIWQSLILHR